MAQCAADSAGGVSHSHQPVSYTHLSYETTDLGRAIEKADYKMGEDGGVIAFIVANKDKNIQLQFIDVYKRQEVICV